MVRLILSVLVCILCFQAPMINAETVFTTGISTDTIQLGKAFTLTLSTNSTTQNLKTVDLVPLKKAFYVNPSSDISYDQKSGYQHLKLRLIAYRIGVAKIPELIFNGRTSQPHNISIIDPIDDKTRTPIGIRVYVSNHQPWLREQTLASVHLTTQFDHAQLKIKPSNQADLLVQALDIESSHNNQQSTFTYKTGWAIFPLKATNLTVTLPPVELIRDGVTTHQFYHPPISLDVKPLPLYIPATIPVGKVTLTAKSQFNYLQTNKLVTNHLELHGQGVLLNFLPDINHQIKSTDSIKIYPETFESSQNNKYDGINSRINYSIPYKSIKQGYARLDNLKITYFDVSKNRLVTQNYSLFKIISLDKWLIWSIYLALAISLVYISTIIFKWISYTLNKVQSYRRALAILDTNCTPDDIKVAIQLLADAEGHPNNTTPHAWFMTLPEKLVKNKMELLDAIQQCLYKSKPERIATEIQTELKNIIRTTQPVMHWLAGI